MSINANQIAAPSMFLVYLIAPGIPRSSLTSKLEAHTGPCDGTILVSTGVVMSIFALSELAPLM